MKVTRFCHYYLENFSWIHFYRRISYKIKQEHRTTQFKEPHHYKCLFPWKNQNELSDFLISSIVYNKDGLIALNKPFGVKIHGHDKPGTRYAKEQRFVIPSIPDCDFTIEDSLPVLKEHLKVPELTIIKSAEKYTSGIVLLSSSEATSRKLKKSFNIAKFQKKPHLVHWGITLGCPIVPARQERVGIKFIVSEDGKEKQPVIETSLSKRSTKLKKIHAVHVDYKAININNTLHTSLIQIASSSVRWHFVRVYASSRVAPILGDIMYSSRMKFLLGVPVKVQLKSSFAYNMQPLPEIMCKKLSISKGVDGHLMVPTMLHLKSIILPQYERKDQDLIIDANPPLQFQWTAKQFNLF